MPGFGGLTIGACTRAPEAAVRGKAKHGKRQPRQDAERKGGLLELPMPESEAGGTGAVMLELGCSLSSFSVIVEVDAERENGLRVPRCVSLSSAGKGQRAA